MRRRYLLAKQENYAWTRPALHAKKLCDLELNAGTPARRCQKRSAAAYSIKSEHERERRWVAQAERVR